MAWHSFSDRSGSVVTCGPTNAIFSLGFASFILVTSLMSPGNPGVDVNSTRNSYCLPSSMVSSADTWCGGASSNREPSSIPAGYASHTGYQYDSISRVAGQRELAPPSKFSNDGGFKNNVFNGMSVLAFNISILCCLLKSRESKRLQAAGQWSISALGGTSILSLALQNRLRSGPMAIILLLLLQWARRASRPRPRIPRKGPRQACSLFWSTVFHLLGCCHFGLIDLFRRRGRLRSQVLQSALVCANLRQKGSRLSHDARS